MLPSNLPDMRLSDDLSRVLRRSDSVPVTIQSVMDEVGDKGFGLLLVVLSLPSALPVPAPGYSIPFGIVLFLIGLQMLSGRKVPSLPRRLGRIRLSDQVAENMIRGTRRFFSAVEFFIRPRLRWVGSYFGRIAMSVLVLIMAILMCIPIPGTNTIPAIAVLLIGIGLVEEDGLFSLLAIVVGVLVAVLYLGAIYYMIAFFNEYGWDTIDHFLSLIKNFLRNLLGFPAAE